MTYALISGELKYLIKRASIDYRLTYKDLQNQLEGLGYGFKGLELKIPHFNSRTGSDVIFLITHHDVKKLEPMNESGWNMLNINVMEPNRHYVLKDTAGRYHLIDTDEFGDFECEFYGYEFCPIPKHEDDEGKQ